MVQDGTPLLCKEAPADFRLQMTVAEVTSVTRVEEEEEGDEEEEEDEEDEDEEEQEMKKKRQRKRRRTTKGKTGRRSFLECRMKSLQPLLLAFGSSCCAAFVACSIGAHDSNKARKKKELS